MTESYQKLIAILKEMFQLDQSDLDFGIYRIMNYKRNEIEKFLNEDLLPQVKTELGKYISVEQKGIEKELKELTEKLEDAGVALESSSKYVALKSKLDNGLNVASAENEVYSHLANFFRRYYSEGDFISLRRYKKDVYAMPYEGEEVKLHWANADQYYIKTAEYFRDYSFTTPDDKKVHFKLVDAETEQNNNISQKEKESRFVIVQEDPLLIENDGLIIRFQYVKNEMKQKDLNIVAVDTIIQLIENVPEFKQFQSLKAIEPTEKNPKRLLIEKYLNDYTSRNSFDYFIHKDLGGFLKRELEFYIKNEVMFLDDIDTEDNLRFDQYLTKVRVIKKIGLKIISFLAQIEDFQKKLWLKKKFIVETNYCITLDKVPEEFYGEIIENKAQVEEWKNLFAIDEVNQDLTNIGYSEPLKVEFLRENQYLLLDTKFFSNEFKEQLISSYENLDEEINGLLIHSENFQALNLLQERYRNKINCLYADPPYNTDATPILYKNNYKDSSWLSLMDSRLILADKLLKKKEGYFSIAIDDYELHNLHKLLEKNLLNRDIFQVIVNHYPGSGTGRSNVTRTHEYNLFVVHKDQDILRGEIKEGGLRERGFCRSGTGDNNYRRGRPNSFYAVLVDESTLEIKGFEEPPEPGNSNYPLENDINGYRRIYPFGEDGSERCWSLSYESAKDALKEDKLKCTKNFVIKRLYLDESDRSLLPSVWIDKKFSAVANGTNLLTNIFGRSGLFSFPKSLYTVQTAIEAGTFMDDKAYYLDFFAGSGTTGHAVINLNREDGGNRKYILIEMGEYFDSVTKHRIQKVIYSKDWKGGKPISREGSSHIFKYIRLESYEDTLNNIEINLTQEQLSLLEKNPELREQYMLSYMLNNETENSTSLLNIDMFRNPFEYKMKIANGLETQVTTIDLVETFNYLLGIEVIRSERKERYNAMEDKNSDVPGAVKLSSSKDGVYVFKEIEGRTSDGDKILVIWRSLSDDIVKDNAALDAYFLKKKYSTQDFEYNRIYVNGDNNLQNLKLDEERWKVVLIEEEFKKLMFDVQDV